MTLQYRAPEPHGDDWKTWARRMMQYLGQTRIPLVQQTGDESAADDGQLMWDRSGQYPVVSKDGAWVPLAMGDFTPTTPADAVFGRTTDLTAAAVDTAYAITYDAPVGNHAIDRDATNNDRIVFSEAGHYMLSFSANIRSTSGSDVEFYFWPRKNGTDVAGSTMVNTLHSNGSTLVVSRTSIIEFDAGDYLQAMWAVDGTDGHLKAHAATSFAPASPATTLAISRIHL